MVIIMKIHEKILYCRKKEGLSQEALAEKLGVSRQAISKWETGDAVPEISKLLLIANTFGVSTDWLLSEDDEVNNKEDERSQETSNFTSQPYTAPNNWVDSVPGVIGRLIRRYGWLVGVYIAVIGTGFIGMGALALYMVRRMFSNSISNFFGGIFSGNTSIQNEFGMENLYNGFGNQFNNTFSSFGVSNNPVYIMGMFIMILGFIMLVAGIILAIILKKKSNE